MRSSSYINNSKCLEWGLNANQGALFDYLFEEHLIAIGRDSVRAELRMYFVIEYKTILQELPVYFRKKDTVYRAFKALIDKGLIVLASRPETNDSRKLIKLTDKGLAWGK